MVEGEIIKKTINFVKKELAQAEGGHDWFHVERVFKNTLLIAKEEKVNLTVVSLAALLHDIADSKFHNGNEAIGPKIAERFLTDENVPQEIITHVVEIIKNMSFKNSFGENENKFSSIELKVVQDADRLDAIGAIGIARCFNYGGFRNRALYNPEISPNLNLSKEEYKNSTAPTINHFYEKLLLLKDKMNTESGKKIAENRHQFMIKYLNQFYDEWNGKL
jgi:uncharacterized protein